MIAARAAADAPRAPPEAELSYAQAEAAAATEAAAKIFCTEALSAAAIVRERLQALAAVTSGQALLLLMHSTLYSTRAWLYST